MSAAVIPPNENTEWSNKMVADLVLQLHSCVHAVGEDVKKVAVRVDAAETVATRDRATAHEAIVQATGAQRQLAEKVDLVVGDVTELKIGLAHVTGIQEGVGQRLGVNTQSSVIGQATTTVQHPKPGVIVITKPWKLIVGGLGCVTGIITLYQIGFPALVAGLVALHHAIMVH